MRVSALSDLLLLFCGTVVIFLFIDSRVRLSFVLNCGQAPKHAWTRVCPSVTRAIITGRYCLSSDRLVGRYELLRCLLDFLHLLLFQLFIECNGRLDVVDLRLLT